MSSFIPKKNSTYDLGSDKYYWKDLYVTDIIRIKEPVKYYTLQDKEVIPSAEEQTITADAGYNGLSMVKVNPIPSNYGKITWNGIYLKVE